MRSGDGLIRIAGSRMCSRSGVSVQKPYISAAVCMQATTRVPQARSAAASFVATSGDWSAYTPRRTRMYVPARTATSKALGDRTPRSCRVVATPPLAANTSSTKSGGMYCMVAGRCAPRNPRLAGLWITLPKRRENPQNPGILGVFASARAEMVTGSPSIRNRPAAPQHRWPGRSPGCSTDPRRTGSCTPQRGPLRSAAPGCRGNGRCRYRPGSACR